MHNGTRPDDFDRRDTQQEAGLPQRAEMSLPRPIGLMPRASAAFHRRRTAGGLPDARVEGQPSAGVGCTRNAMSAVVRPGMAQAVFIRSTTGESTEGSRRRVRQGPSSATTRTRSMVA